MRIYNPSFLQNIIVNQSVFHPNTTLLI